MPAVYNPSVARVLVSGTMDGQEINNTLHVDSPEAWTAERLTTLVGIIIPWLTIDYLPLLSDTYDVNLVTADSLAGINAPQFVSAAGLPASGANASPALPNNVALCVSGKTGFRGRSGRGRWFVAGLCENQVTGSRVAQVTREALVAQFEELRLELIESNMRPVVYSTISQGEPRPLGIAFPITSFAIIDDVVDSQRRRLPGRGV